MQTSLQQASPLLSYEQQVEKYTYFLIYPKVLATPFLGTV